MRLFQAEADGGNPSSTAVGPQEIANCSFGVRGRGIEALRPMQWQNYVDFMVAARSGAAVTADGLRNVRRLL